LAIIGGKMLKDFVAAAQKMTKNPLGILALLIVLVYAIAGIVSGSGNFVSPERIILVWFLVLFPVIVLFNLTYLVTKHHDKLYAPSDFADERNFVKLIDSRLKDSPRFRQLEAVSSALEEEINAIAAKDSDQDDAQEPLAALPEETSQRRLEPEKEKVLYVLRDGTHTYRSVSGLSGETEFTRNKVRDILFELENEGLIGIRDRGNGPKYFINKEGRDYLKSLLS